MYLKPLTSVKSGETSLFIIVTKKKSFSVRGKFICLVNFSYLSLKGLILYSVFFSMTTLCLFMFHMMQAHFFIKIFSCFACNKSFHSSCIINLCL